MNRNRRSKEVLVCGLLVAGILLSSGTKASGDFVFGTPENLGPVVNTQIHEWSNKGLSDDGLSFVFNRRDPDYTTVEAWLVTRSTTGDSWGAPISLGIVDMLTIFNLPEVQTCCAEFMSPDELELYVGADWPGGQGSSDIWIMEREYRDDLWGTPNNLGPGINSRYTEFFTFISRNGLELFFLSDRPGGYGSLDHYVTKRSSLSDPWGHPENLGPEINSTGWDADLNLSADGLVIVFTSNRSGGYGGWDLYMAKRKSISDPWEESFNLGSTINTNTNDGDPQLSADGSTLYWGSRRPGGYGNYDIWQAPIIPIVDLNADGIVDAVDMCMIVDNWGTNNSLCDIGPMPWGDGVVDVQDLIVLAEHLFEEYPPAEPVE